MYSLKRRLTVWIIIENKFSYNYLTKTLTIIWNINVTKVRMLIQKFKNLYPSRSQYVAFRQSVVHHLLSLQFIKSMCV